MDIISQTAVKLSLFGAPAFVVLLAVLHIIKPEINPMWRLISEYEIGRHGWIMRCAFLCLSVSVIGIVVSAWSYVSTLGGHISLIAFFIIGIALIGAAIFTSDPITAKGDTATLFGGLHTLSGVIVILGFPIIAIFVGSHLTRNIDNFPNVFVTFTILVWIGFLAFVGSAVFFTRGKDGFGPDVLVGLPNRFMMATYSLWLFACAWELNQLFKLA